MKRQITAFGLLSRVQFGACALFIWAAPALAGDGAAPTEFRASLADEPGISRPVTVGLNKSKLIDRPGEVGEVVISDPSVVDAVLRSARRVHLLGQKIGQATASFIGRDGRQSAAPLGPGGNQ
jgi:pilus assembly protein CpaC